MIVVGILILCYLAFATIAAACSGKRVFPDAATIHFFFWFGIGHYTIVSLMIIYAGYVTS